MAFLHRIPTTHLSFLVNSNKTVSERAGKEKKKRNVVFYTLQKVRESLFFQEIFEEEKKEKRFPEDALVFFFRESVKATHIKIRKSKFFVKKIKSRESVLKKKLKDTREETTEIPRN